MRSEIIIMIGKQKCNQGNHKKFSRYLHQPKKLLQLFSVTAKMLLMQTFHTHYAELLRRLNDTICREFPENFQQASSVVHICYKAWATTNECGFELLEHPSCSPDPTFPQNSFCMFSTFKNHLCGQCFEDKTKKVIMEWWMVYQDFWKNGITKLESHCN